MASITPAWLRVQICLLASIVAVALPVSHANAQTHGLDALAPFEPFFGGVFPSSTPGPSGIQTQPVSSNLGVGMLLTLTRGDGVMYAGSRDGRIIELVPGSTTESGTVFMDISDRVWTGQDSGLLGVAFHPQFDAPPPDNRDYIYLYYVHEAGDGDRFIRLSRFERPSGQTTGDPGSEMILIQQKLGPTLHRGGGLLFGMDGFLYLSIGDLGWPDQSQEITNLFNSCVLRIDVDQDPGRSHAIPTQPDTSDPETYTQGYTIPDDNPFVGLGGGVLEEYYTLGSRNPHRMTLDPESGVMVIGNVGSNSASSLEELNVVVAGANYGWPFREAYADIAPRPSTIWGTVTDPELIYGHEDGTCIIGGHVYRGTSIPWLVGRYVFGDCTNNRIWAAQDERGSPPKELLTTASAQLVTFGRDDAGEIYVGTGASTLYRLEPSSFVAEPPALLSETGVFADLVTLTPVDAFIPYDVNTPLWSDDADKKRWLAVPNGTGGIDPIQYSESGNWTFPVGSLFVKHFELPVPGGPPRRVETRFLAHGVDGKIYGVTYRWRPDGLDADLLSDGLTEVIEGQTWDYPSRLDCIRCHNTVAGSILGPRTSQLNGETHYPVTDRLANQLVTLDFLGLLSPSLGSTDPTTLPKLAAIDDLQAFSQTRVRSYLQANCAHCHQPGGPARGEFDARFQTPFAQQKLINTGVAEDFGIAGAKVVVPGDVGKSILHHRDALLGAGQMPPLARNLVDAEWTTLLADWIGIAEEPIAAPFHGEYYDGVAFDTWMFERDDDLIDFDWVNGTPDPSLGNDLFSIRWTGTLLPAFSETYTFVATADDGVRVFVDGNLVVDDWTIHAAREASGTIPLTAGVSVPFIVEFFENGGQASVAVDWLSASLPRTPVVAAVPNTAPSATPRSESVDSGAPLSLVLGGTDAEQASLDVAIVDFPANGTLSGTGPNLVYVSTNGFEGEDSFTFKVSDGEFESPPATVEITVPEPGATALLAMGFGLLQALKRRRSRSLAKVGSRSRLG